MRILNIFLIGSFLLLMPAIPYAQNPMNITRLSIATDGQQGNGDSILPAANADGRYIVFQSWASNLVKGDTNNTWDIFVQDRLTGETRRASVASNGTQANGKNESPSISGDGRFVAFSSIASNLTPDITNYKADIFVHDMKTGETTRASVSSDGKQGNGPSTNPSISADGRYVAFVSLAYNLVPNDTNNKADIFVFDRFNKKTIRVSVASDGTQSNDNSTDASMRTNGRFIAFTSAASNLAPKDTNGKADVFIHDLETKETKRVSVASNGTEGNGNSARPRISLDGEYVVFTSEASNLVPGDTNNYWDVFFHNVKTGETARESVSSDNRQGNGNSTRPRLSRGDGRFIVFASEAENLIPNDNNTNNVWNIFVHDRTTKQTLRVSKTFDGKEANNASDFPAVSSDGKYIVFDSWASNLVGNDTNHAKDIFVVNNPLSPLPETK